MPFPIPRFEPVTTMTTGFDIAARLSVAAMDSRQVDSTALYLGVPRFGSYVTSGRVVCHSIWQML